MIITTIKIIALSWIGYNGWRVFSSQRNSVVVGAEVQAACPHYFAFQTYLRVRDYYLELSPAHEKYEISGNNLMENAVIDIWETAGFQSVKHKYRVTEFKTNERMKLVSERSCVKTLGLFKGMNRSEVEFRFHPASDGKTNIGLTIQVVFPNWFRQFMARLFFTEAIWNHHAFEEMNALARIMEQQFHATKVA